MESEKRKHNGENEGEKTEHNGENEGEKRKHYGENEGEKRNHKGENEGREDRMVRRRVGGRTRDDEGWKNHNREKEGRRQHDGESEGHRENTMVRRRVKSKKEDWKRTGELLVEAQDRNITRYVVLPRPPFVA